MYTGDNNLTLCLPVSSGDNLGKQFGPRSGPTIRHSEDIPEFFQKVNFEKKSADKKS